MLGIHSINTAVDSEVKTLKSKTDKFPVLVVEQPKLLEHFNLSDFGIDKDAMINELKGSFDKLPPDEYHRKLRQVQFLKGLLPGESKRLERFLEDYYASDSALSSIQDLLDRLSPSARVRFDHIKTQRNRAIAKFKIEVTGSEVAIERVPVGAFVQYGAPAGSPLALPRYFEEASDEVVNNPHLRALLKHLALEVAGCGHTSMEVVMHEVLMNVSPGEPFILPEGIHHDGSDYVISAVPIILENVVVPVSTVYDGNKTPLISVQLKPGEGLLHDDRGFWHSVSDLHANAKAGRRGTIGFDVHVLN